MNINVAKVFHGIKAVCSKEYRLGLQEAALVISIKLYLGAKDASLDVFRHRLSTVERQLVEYLAVCPAPAPEFWENFLRHEGIFTLMAVATKYKPSLASRCMRDAMSLARVQLQLYGHMDRAQNAGVCLAAARYFNQLAGSDPAVEAEIVAGFKKVEWFYTGPSIFRMP